MKEANDLAEQREVSLVECQKQLADAESRIKDLASKLGAVGAKTQTDSVKGKVPTRFPLNFQNLRG